MPGMDMKKLFYDRIVLSGKQIPHTHEYDSTTELFSVVKEEMVAQMPESAKAMYVDYENYADKLTTLQNEECFVRGMALGIRITSEAFILDGNDQLNQEAV